MSLQVRDKYPKNIEFEINREGLAKYYYLNTRKLISWVIMALLFMFGIVPFIDWLDVIIFPDGGPAFVVLCVFFLCWICCYAGGKILAYPIALFWKKACKEKAASYRVAVKGDFLHIKVAGQGSSQDKLIHFRALVDYAHETSPTLEKCGIESIAIQTTAGGQTSTMITLLGLVRSCEVRDQLAEIDALRENS